MLLLTVITCVVVLLVFLAGSPYGIAILHQCGDRRAIIIIVTSVSVCYVCAALLFAYLGSDGELSTGNPMFNYIEYTLWSTDHFISATGAPVCLMISISFAYISTLMHIIICPGHCLDLSIETDCLPLFKCVFGCVFPYSVLCGDTKFDFRTFMWLFRSACRNHAYDIIEWILYYTPLVTYVNPFDLLEVACRSNIATEVVLDHPGLNITRLVESILADQATKVGPYQRNTNNKMINVLLRHSTRYLVGYNLSAHVGLLSLDVYVHRTTGYEDIVRATEDLHNELRMAVAMRQNVIAAM